MPALTHFLGWFVGILRLNYIMIPYLASNGNLPVDKDNIGGIISVSKQAL